MTVHRRLARPFFRILMTQALSRFPGQEKHGRDCATNHLPHSHA